MSKWKMITLGEIADVRDGTHNSPKQQDEGEYLITSRHIKNGNIDFSSAYKISLVDYEEVNQRSKVHKWDVLFSMIGTIGEMTIVDFEPNFAIKNIGLFKTNGDKNLAKWIYYYFKSYEAKAEIDASLKGSTQQYITLEDLRRFPITLPPLPEQKAIAGVLSSLDDKIDLLHRQNRTLEAMAEALFRQWFVEEAKNDWEETKLYDICSVITKGTTPTTLGKQFVESGINFIKVESITDEGDFLPEKFAKISSKTNNILKRSIIKSNDVLCSIAGTIGRIAIIDESILPANTNQAIAILRVNEGKCFGEFIYLFLKSKLFQETMDGKIVHAVQPNLSLGEIGNSIIYIPNQEELQSFKKLIAPIFEKKKANQQQIRTLERLRDTLLPKLMSGEVRVMV